MNASVEQLLAERMAQLSNTYRQRMANDCTELCRLADLQDGSPADTTAMKTMRHLLHGLAGSAGTFGFHGVSERARALEVRVDQWLLGGEAINPTKWLQLQHDLSALRLEAIASMTSAASVAALPLPAATAPADTEAAPHDEGASLWLLAPDTPSTVQLKSELLPFGYRIWAVDPRQMTTADVPAPDAILIDLTLLEPFAEHTQKALAAQPSRKPPPALICLADRNDFDARIAAARAGCEGYALRPLDAPQLVALIEDILSRRRPDPERVLVVEDDAELAEHYRLVLNAAGMSALTVADETHILEVLAEIRPDLVLTGMRMPHCSGPELAAVIRQHPHWTGLPIIYLSAETDLKRQTDALSRGGDDFLTKPIADTHLVAAVRVRVARARQLAELMTRDSLTGLLKHASFKGSLEAEVARSLRTKRPLCAVMLDIDHFKRINDSYGHSTGDIVIATLATILRQRLRKSDIIGRYGGEEFAAAMLDCDADVAAPILDELRSRFAAVHFNAAGTLFTSSLSCGYACTGEFPGLSAAELLERADAALYHAKRTGRNRICSAATLDAPAES